MNDLYAHILTQAKSNPNNTAVFIDQKHVTYSALMNYSNSLCALAEESLSPFVYIYAEKRLSSYAAILGVLQSGKCYVPLNPSFPEQRNADIIDQVGSGLLIADSRDEDAITRLQHMASSSISVLLVNFLDDKKTMATHLKLSDSKAGDINSIRIPTNPASSDAYLLFTSGSTGKPKGITVTRHNLCAYIHRVSQKLRLNPQDRLTQLFDLTFDLSMHDIFLCWSAGASLYIPSYTDKLFPDRYIHQHQLTVWFSVPSVIQQLKSFGRLTINAFPSLRLSLFCGESLSIDAAQVWQKAAANSALYNLYGPTEATIAFTFCHLDQHYLETTADKIASIGKAFDGLAVAIIDDNDKLISEPHTEGQLLLGGDQLSAGYWKNAALSSLAFFEADYKHPEINRWYRTGDVASYNANGDLSFHGRRDAQVKINGYRIELKEIESVIEQLLPQAHCAVATFSEPKKTVIIAFVALSNTSKSIDFSSILNKIKKELPSYSMPQKIIELKNLPRNANGKIDYKKLTEYDINALAHS